MRATCFRSEARRGPAGAAPLFGISLANAQNGRNERVSSKGGASSALSCGSSSSSSSSSRSVISRAGGAAKRRRRTNDTAGRLLGRFVVRVPHCAATRSESRTAAASSSSRTRGSSSAERPRRARTGGLRTCPLTEKRRGAQRSTPTRIVPRPRPLQTSPGRLVENGPRSRRDVFDEAAPTSQLSRYAFGGIGPCVVAAGAWTVTFPSLSFSTQPIVGH